MCVVDYGKEEIPEMQACPEWSVTTCRCVMEAYWST